MPIATQDLGKYRRPGIFIEEIDNSIVEIPVQDVLINLVPGFSKRGPINKPVYVTNRKDFEDIFGEIDRQLERKGSYFHRTVIKMLESGPVWALNLLSLEDDRDKVQWVSVSLSSKYDNYGTTLERTIPYSKIYNRQDFWERDDEAFLDYLKTLDGQWSADRLLEMTNVGNKALTVFLFKSSVTGFDITAEEWWGGRDKVPNYISPTDWISDWMVNVVILQGDWTDYKSLSVDPKWGDYFTQTGLLKENIEDFLNEREVAVLTSTDVSLIPYFTDLDGRDLYIKSKINQNTDKWKLFISYNEEEILDSDFPIDTVDILGNNLVGSTTGSIDFMSYNQSIIETINIPNKYLNAPGNTYGNIETIEEYEEGISSISTYDSRNTADYTNWYVNDVKSGTTTSEIVFVTGATSGDTILLTTGHTLTDGQPIYFNNTMGTVAKNTIYYVYIPAGLNYDEIKLKESYDPDDVLSPITGIDYSSISIKTMGISSFWTVNFDDYGTGGDNPYYVFDDKYTIDTGTTMIPLRPIVLKPNPSSDVSQTDVIYIKKGETTFTVGSESADLDEDTIIIATVDQTLSTGSTLTGNTISASYSPVTINGDGYVPLSLTITTGGTSGDETMIIDFSDTGNEYIDFRRGLVHELLETKIQEGAGQGKFVLINLTDASKHIVGQDYLIDDSTIAFTGLDTANNYFSGSTFLVHYIDNEFVISSTDTDRLLTTELAVEDLLTSGMTGVNAAGVIGKHSTIYDNYYDGVITNGDFLYKYNDATQLTQIYLRMYIDSNDDLTVDFTNGGTSPEPIDGWTDTSKYDMQLDIISKTGSLIQSVELENTSMYTDLTNTRKIWIDKTRYSEVKLGIFLERYYNANDLELGQTPKKLTRVIKTYNDSTNTNWKIIETDGPIKITKIAEVDYQTVMYSSVEDYVTEYKGLKIKPFTISKESVPNGTDERQNAILSVIDKSTNLFKALVDKNKISWRYLVDSFGLGLNVSAYPGGSKQQYADLCGEKKNCFGFVNMPSVKDFKNSQNPNFLDEDGVFDTAYLLEGGNPDLSPPYLYEFAKGVGRSTVGYFFPYVKQVDSAGIPIEVPPSAFCATTYMQKFLGAFAGIQPWTIAAGINNGRIEGIGGTEMDFNTTDEENLFQMGANPLTFKRNIGYVINSENTAQVFPRSSLSYIHSREVLIELENRIYDMLLQYQWRFNTPEVRSEIKYKADAICKEIRDNNGLYNFRNVMDETNNTDLIIDLQMGVLDTYIEIIKGMGIIVNNITILRKGAIESGGFL